MIITLKELRPAMLMGLAAVMGVGQPAPVQAPARSSSSSSAKAAAAADASKTGLAPLSDKAMASSSSAAAASKNLGKRKGRDSTGSDSEDEPPSRKDPNARWQENYKKLLAYSQANPGKAVPVTYVTADQTRLGNWVREQKKAIKSGKILPERLALLRAIGSMKWETRLERGWDENLKDLVEYSKAHPGSQVPVLHVTADGHKLGRWVMQQKKEMKDGKLSDQRVAALKAVPGLQWEIKAPRGWDAFYQDLVAYRQAHPEGEISRTALTPAGDKLGSWISQQQYELNLGTLSAERLARLQAIPELGLKSKGRHSWQAFYQDLVAYHQANPGSQVKHSVVTEAGDRLGVWVATQRANIKAGTLSAEREALLRALQGLDWGRKALRPWSESYQDLVAYSQAHPGTQVPTDYETPAGNKLGIWVMQQKQKFRKGLLSEERSAELAKIPGMEWHARTTRKWVDFYADLVAYSQAHPGAQVPVAFKTADGHKLGLWVRRQKEAMKTEVLVEQRVALLRSIPGLKWETSGQVRGKKASDSDSSSSEGDEDSEESD